VQRIVENSEDMKTNSASWLNDMDIKLSYYCQMMNTAPIILG